MRAIFPILLGLIFLAAGTTPTLGSSGAIAHEESFASESNPTKVRILEALGRSDTPASDTMFDQALGDESFEVRRAAVIQFLKSRSHLAVAQQTDRFKKSFQLKPYQARLDAMLGFLSLPLAERTKLSAVVDSRFKSDCRAEQHSEVKEACAKILASQPSEVAAKETK